MRNSLQKRTWAEVSLDNISYNYRAIRAALPEGCRFLGVVKADAYGHGAVAVGVGLDHAQKPAALRQGGADGAVVVADVVKADLGPCSLLQAVSHTFPLLSHCNSFILSLGTERDAMPSGVLLGIGTRLAVDGQFLAV